MATTKPKPASGDAKPTAEADKSAPAVNLDTPPDHKVAVRDVRPIDYGTDAGAGMEGAVAESFAIPFLRILQTNSPQCEEGEQFVEGAKPGMFYDSVTGRMWDGKEGVLLIPCAYRRVFLHWGPRSGEGAGFKGELSAEDVDRLIDGGKLREFENKLMFPLADGTLNPKRCAHVSDTRNHYVMALDGANGNMNCLLSLSSTQIKKSKLLMSMLAAKRVPNGNGSMVVPPTFAQIIRATTLREENDDGSWYGVKFTFERMVDDKPTYNEAKKFYEIVRAGNIKANYEDSTSAAGAERQRQRANGDDEPF